MEETKNQTNDPQKKKEKIYESSLEEAEICKFPIRRYFHNKTIITDDVIKDKDIKEKINFQNNICEEKNKIENIETKQNNNSGHYQKVNCIIEKTTEEKNNVYPNLPTINTDRENANLNLHLHQKTFKEIIDNKNKEECLHNLTIQNYVNIESGYFNLMNSNEQIQTENNIEKEEVHNSRIFSIAIDNASADAMGNNVVMEISNVGCNMMEIHIPPLGETHFLPDLP